MPYAWQCLSQCNLYYIKMETTQTVQHKGYALVNYGPFTQWHIHEYKMVNIITINFTINSISWFKSFAMRSVHVLLS